MGNVKIIETGNRFGNMNGSAFPKDWSKEERQAGFIKHRKMVGEAYGFSWQKMFMADQSDKTGTYFEIDQDYVTANPNGWSDIRQDILIVTDKVPGVVIGHPVADCPVIMMEDTKQKVLAIAHCSAELVDLKMPMMIADALLSAYGTADEDIATYVSACAGNSWTYDSYPGWAKDSKVWEEGLLKDENGIYHIDLRKAILNELVERKIRTENITVQQDDTITHPGYYSNNAASPYGLNDPSKFGRNFAGAFYKESIKELTKVKTRF